MTSHRFEVQLTDEMRQRFALRRVVAIALARCRPLDGLDHRFRQKLVAELAEGLYDKEVRVPSP